MTVAKQSHDQVMDLENLGFSFAVEKIDPTLGRIEAKQVRWSGLDGKKRETPIELESCTKMANAKDLQFESSFSAMRDSMRGTKKDYLCPSLG